MQTAPFGSWKSALGAEELAAATVRFGQIAIAGDSIFASEGRPAEGGRNVVVECDAAGRCADLNPAPFDVRNRVHEYGGGAFVVAADGEVFFCHDADQRIYRVRRGEAPRPVTRGGALRYADAVLDAAARPADRGSRGPLGQGRGGQHPRRHRPRSRRRDACWRAATTSSPTRGSRPTAHGSPG